MDAAIGLIKNESAGIMQTKRVQAELDSCVMMLDQEAERLESIGAVYARLQAQDGVGVSQGVSTLEPTVPGTLQIERRLGARVQLVTDQTVTKWTEAARQALAADDAALAEGLIQNTSGWQGCASPSVQAECKAVQSEISAAKKVLYFRKSHRR
jgi:hypothetical protein